MTDVLDPWKIAQILVAALVGVMLWNFRRLQAKADDAVSKDDFKDALSILRGERDAQYKESRDERLRLHQENVANFRELAQKLDMQLVHEQRISQCERGVTEVTKYAEGLKHRYIDPYLIEAAKIKQRLDTMEAQRS
jgi:hypothetical protein